jgi:hypothetical protein
MAYKFLFSLIVVIIGYNLDPTFWIMWLILAAIPWMPFLFVFATLLLFLVFLFV